MVGVALPQRTAKEKAEYMREYRKANPSHNKETISKWRKNNPERFAYQQQKQSARRRGIAFELDFEEWLAWWGEDYALRGKHRGALVMCRHGDTGPYSLDNIYKDSNINNGKLSRKLQMEK